MCSNGTKEKATSSHLDLPWLGKYAVTEKPGVLTSLNPETQRFTISVCLHLCPFLSIYLDISRSSGFLEISMHGSVFTELLSLNYHMDFYPTPSASRTVCKHLHPKPRKREEGHKTFLFVLTRKDRRSRMCERKSEKERETDCQSWS